MPLATSALEASPLLAPGDHATTGTVRFAIATFDAGTTEGVAKEADAAAAASSAAVGRVTALEERARTYCSSGETEAGTDAPLAVAAASAARAAPDAYDARVVGLVE